MNIQTRQHIRSIAVIILITVVAACKKSTDTDEKPDVYIAGFESNGTNNIAKVWKNGTPILLTDGRYNAEANSVFVSGGDVYVAGFESNGIRRVAKVWKNGVPTSLTNDNVNADAYAVFVVGSDVYVSGYNSDPMNFGKVWKNGRELYTMNESNFGIFLRSLYVTDNGDVYVAGSVGTATITAVAKAWKNGTELYTLSNSNQTTGAFSVYVYNGDIYVAGSVHRGFRIWKNGFSLYDDDMRGRANAVYVAAGDVYAAGYETGVSSNTAVAKIWKNGEPTSLTDGTRDAKTLSLRTWKNDVYAVGYTHNGQKSVATVWKNGEKSTLTNGLQNAVANSIYITHAVE